MTGYRAIIIGAGSVGVNAALFLDRLGHHVTLLEPEQDILTGAAQLSFINHGDGFEYFKPHHHRTGKYCVEGSLAKGLMYSLSRLRTGVCSPASPIRFLVSRGSVDEGRISVEGFNAYTSLVYGHYARYFKGIQARTGLSPGECSTVLGRSEPGTLAQLGAEDFRDVRGILTGVNGNGFGIHMPHYYAILKTALAQSGVQCHFRSTVRDIRHKEKCVYEVTSDGQTWTANQVLVCSSHHIPQVAATVRDVPVVCEFAGTYFLNSMTFLELPPTSEDERLRLASRINFTLMESHGCMYACILPPTRSRAGLAAIYYPDSCGSQLASHVCRCGERSAPPASWDDPLRGGLPHDHPNVRATFDQARKLYPFLDGYATVARTDCRTVFNVDVPDSEGGLDRRVRELSAAGHALTADGRISAWTAPKWTNAELSALMAVDHFLQTEGLPGLPTCSDLGFGPTHLDVAAISKAFSFRHINAPPGLARTYALASKLPLEMVVDNSSPGIDPVARAQLLPASVATSRNLP